MLLSYDEPIQYTQLTSEKKNLFHLNTLPSLSGYWEKANRISGYINTIGKAPDKPTQFG